MNKKRPQHICQRCLSQWTYDDICDECHAQKYFAHLAAFEQKEENIIRPKRNWSDGIASRIKVDFYKGNN